MRAGRRGRKVRAVRILGSERLFLVVSIPLFVGGPLVKQRPAFQIRGPLLRERSAFQGTSTWRHAAREESYFFFFFLAFFFGAFLAAAFFFLATVRPPKKVSARSVSVTSKSQVAPSESHPEQKTEGLTERSFVAFAQRRPDTR